MNFVVATAGIHATCKSLPVGRMEQLADSDVGRNDPVANGLNDYVNFLERDDSSVRCMRLPTHSSL